MPGTSKKSLKRKRDAEKARTNALFTGDAFFAIDTGADEAARAKVQREEVARHSAKADTGSSTEPQPATKGSHTVLEESSSESEAADSDAEGAGDELFMNIESSTKPAPGLEDSDPSDLEEESFRQQFEAETEARSNPR